jgi:hypothetical protein
MTAFVDTFDAVAHVFDRYHLSHVNDIQLPLSLALG